MAERGPARRQVRAGCRNGLSRRGEHDAVIEKTNVHGPWRTVGREISAGEQAAIVGSAVLGAAFTIPNLFDILTGGASP